MSDRESVELKDFQGDIEGVDNRRADSATDPGLFQVLEGIIPWDSEHRRMFGKKPHGKFSGALTDNLAIITIHPLTGGHILYQTQEGLVMDTKPLIVPAIKTIAPGPSRNDFAGYVGLNFQAVRDLTITHLGRYVLGGNNQVHQVTLRDITGGAPLATANIDCNGATSGQFKYEAIAPVTFPAGHSGVISSEEFFGGDIWYDFALTITMDATDMIALGPCYSFDNISWANVTAGYMSYVPCNFLYED